MITPILAPDATLQRRVLAATAISHVVVTPAATAAMMGTVEKGRAGIAAGMLNAARQIGAALGVAVFGVLARQGVLMTGFQVALWGAVAVSLLAASLW